MIEIVIALILIGLILLFGVIFFILTNKQNKRTTTKKENPAPVPHSVVEKREIKKDPKHDVKKEDVFSFMEFEKVMDDMIVQQNGTKFTMAIKCKGINYDLMSEVEQLAVEEGFITFLNTLRYPIQLYVQAQNVDLKKNIKLYNDRLVGLKDEYDSVNEKYTSLLNSLDTTDDELKAAETNREVVQNVLEYANDIVKYVEKISVNKNLLQRSFYVLVSYFSSEISSIDKFNKEEIYDICYSELYTRAQGIISALATCSVNSKVLNSNELAELLYVSYNRDDKNIINIDQALESGFYRLYSTSEDAFTKKNKILDEYIQQEAEIKALEAIQAALKNGTYVPKEIVQQETNESITKTAISYVKNEKVDEEIKENAKKILIQEYREKKREIEEKNKAEMENQNAEIKKENTSVQENENEDKVLESKEEDDLIIDAKEENQNV